MTRIAFETAIVGRTDGTLSIALLARLSPPFPQQSICVAIVECSTSAAEGLCRELGSALRAAQEQRLMPREHDSPSP